MKYLQSFWGLRSLGPHQGAALDLLGGSQGPQTPSCICNDLWSLRIVPSAQYLAAPSTPSRTETFLHTKISHPLRLSKKILLLEERKRVKKFLASVKIIAPPPPPPPPPESNGPSLSCPDDSRRGTGFSDSQIKRNPLNATTVFYRL